MYMWFWWGYDLGDFLFQGLKVSTELTFAITWIVLFVFATLFEGSKVYLARVQRAAQQRLYPHRSDERRNLLCHRDQDGLVRPSTSRNDSSGHINRIPIRVRMLVNFYQTVVFLTHNVAGYLLMLAVMLYNFYLLLAVVLGMTLGYFLFGTKLTKLQMQCFRGKRVVICTPECDDTAEGTTPPLLNSSLSSESDLFICQTRTCIQPSHYFPASSSHDGGETSNATCYYGAKQCPSKVARMKKLQAQVNIHYGESEKEDSPSVEDVQLLRTERQGCCKKKQEPPPEEKFCKTSHLDAFEQKPEQSCCKKKKDNEELDSLKIIREKSPQISCCHNAKITDTESQEQIA